MMGASGQLRVEFDGAAWHLTPGEELTFGRAADIVVDTNRHLHRRLGVFRCRDGVWWLANTGAVIALDVCDAATPSRMTIAPASAAPVPFAHNLVRFRAGSAVYELEATIRRDDRWEDVVELPIEATTIDASRVELNQEQRLLLVALAELRLLDRSSSVTEIPPNRVIADRLGWAITKFNRKLDYLCTRFDRLGVPGLKGDVAGLASNRRERLVDHVVTSGLIRVEDLALLSEHGRPAR